MYNIKISIAVLKQYGGYVLREGVLHYILVPGASGNVFCLLKQNKLKPILVTSQIQHLVLSSIQSQYSQTILDYSQNGLVFIEAEAFN